MKKLLFLLFTLLSLLKCQTKSKNTEYDLMEIKEINEIVKAIINQDSLNISKNTDDSKMFCSELKKINIEIPTIQKDVIVPPPIPRNRYIREILNLSIDNELFFSKKDSLFIMEQQIYSQKIKIDNTVLNQINATLFEIEMTKRKNGEQYDFYEMKIPIFSFDRLKAYVELDHLCGRLCGSGKGIFLKKINGNWKIINKRITWIS